MIIKFLPIFLFLFFLNVQSVLAQGVCRDNPETPPAGYKWAANCSSSGSCESNAGCPTGANNQEGWCYGFEDGNRCLQLQSTGANPVPTSTPLPTATPAVL